MKHKLMMLLTLIVTPTWAAETATPLPAQTSVTIQLSGSSKSVQALQLALTKDVVYADAECSSKPMKKSAQSTSIKCTKATGALLDYFVKNTPPNVRWSISKAIKAKAVLCMRKTCSGVTGCFTKTCAVCSPCS